MGRCCQAVEDSVETENVVLGLVLHQIGHRLEVDETAGDVADLRIAGIAVVVAGGCNQHVEVADVASSAEDSHPQRRRKDLTSCCL